MEERAGESGLVVCQGGLVSANELRREKVRLKN
jgi:hypothetical protein